MTPGFFHRALDPLNARKINAVNIFQVASDPDSRRLGIERRADPLASEILGLLDASRLVHADEGVAERLGWEYRDGDKGADLLRRHGDVLGERHFRQIEFLRADHAVEDFPWRLDFKKVQIDALDVDQPIVQRLHTVIRPTGEGQWQFGHWLFSPPILTRSRENNNQLSLTASLSSRRSTLLAAFRGNTSRNA